MTTSKQEAEEKGRARFEELVAAMRKAIEKRIKQHAGAGRIVPVFEHYPSELCEDIGVILEAIKPYQEAGWATQIDYVNHGDTLGYLVLLY